MKTNHSFNKSVLHKAFTLVELLGIMTIIAILAGIASYSMLGLIEQNRLKKERENLDSLKREIEASFQVEDMNRNISAIKGEIATDSVSEGLITVFDLSSGASLNLGKPSANCELHGWYSKLATSRGITYEAGATKFLESKVNFEGPMHDITYNFYNNRRILLIGPTNDENSQRYLLLSFMFSPGLGGQLLLNGPSNIDTTSSDYKIWFDALYDFDWNAKGDAQDPPSTAGSPASWWTKKRGGAKLSCGERVLAARIVQPRYRVFVNNLTTDDVVDIRSNLGGFSASFATAGAASYFLEDKDSLTNLTPTENIAYTGWVLKTGFFPDPTPPLSSGRLAQRGLLAGRRVIVRNRKGETQMSFLINSNETVTFQDGQGP